MKLLICISICVISLEQAFSQCACCAGAGIGSSNGENMSNLTLTRNMWQAETYADYRTIQNGRAPEGDEKLLKNMFIYSLGAQYGIKSKFSLSALLPYVYLHTGSGNDKGLGDLILIGTYRIFSGNDFKLAIQGGIELPTGVQKASNFDNTDVIIGSGSYDPLLGIAFNKTWNIFLLQGSVLYKKTTNGFSDNYYGSLSTQNISMVYQIFGFNNTCSVDSSSNISNYNWRLSLSGGYYGEWLDQLEEDDQVDADSGHYLGFMTLGSNISFKKWTFPITFSVPIINRINGEQNKAGYRLRLGVVKSF